MSKISAFRSGVGDGLHLKVGGLDGQTVKEPLTYELQATGKYEENIPVFDKKTFSYRFRADGMERVWGGTGDILLRLKYYPKKTANFKLEAEYFDPSVFSYSTRAEVDFYRGDPYDINVKYQLFALGHVKIAQVPFNYKVGATMTYLTKTSSQGTVAIISDSFTGSVGNENYDYSTAKALTETTARQILERLAENYKAAHPDISSYKMSNYWAESSDSKYVVYTHEQGEQPVFAFTTNIGHVKTVTNGVIYNTTLGFEDANKLKRLGSLPIQEVLADTIEANNIHVREFYVVDEHDFSQFYIDDDGYVHTWLSGHAITSKSRVSFFYEVVATITYRDEEGSTQQTVLISDPMSAATTENLDDEDNNLLSRHTPKQIMHRQINDWQVENRIPYLDNVIYMVRLVEGADSIIHTIGKGRVTV